ncbi:unnamed protein product [Triticum turgidum subsp. durum]|uniref:NB-ARC domain-containing protein n=1 Tax=Triticum turgidum subsp. durum TaxID=4567 RepID=A0A9R1P9W9_TRITD|nr:unnamed protein product [Triticum turgidum subsp. durum]
MVKIQDASASSGPGTDDTDAALIEAAMRVPVTVMLGPMGTLLRKFHSLMAPGQSLASDLLRAEEVCLLSDGLKDLCISLKNMSEDDDPSFMAQWWMKIVRELCYDTEDHLDEVCCARTHHDFSEFLARAEDACESRKCFDWSPPKTIKPAEQGGAGVSRRTSPELQVLLPVHVEPPNNLVELLDLHDDGKTLKVIPITGCAGVGKTTAARALYHRYGGKFQCRAFVTVSRNPDMRGFLTSILSQLKAPRSHGFPDVPDLIDAIRKHLQHKRYIIVIDDLWTSSVWNIISRAFPRGDYCSRIITTTQIDDVALACCSYNQVDIYKMFPLKDPESRKLFFSIVFGSEDGCPIDIKEVSYDIVQKCAGLPLAIVNIASLLASESNIVRERWEHIQDSLPSTSGEMMDVLNLLYNILPHLMYNSLPPRLRTCLLYFSMYSEGHVIKKDELVKLWAAEGFSSVVKGRDTQEIVEGYFDELVSRGMVQAVDTNNNGEVLTCTVHQMVLDFIRLKSMEENFVIHMDHYQSTLTLPDKVRRLSIQFGGVKGAYIPESIVTSQVRSLIFWGFFKCVPSIVHCGLIRILILHIWADEDNESFDLTGIGELVLLKYLETECNIAVELPNKDNIPWLQQLETLQVDARLSCVPFDIVNMKRLLHLRLPSEYILPSVVAQMTSLRTLGYLNVSSHTVGAVLHLGELTNLQHLQLTCSMIQPAEIVERNVQCLGSLLEKLSALQSLTLVPTASVSYCVNILEDGFSIVSPPTLDLPLRKIKLSRSCCIFGSLPKWFEVLRNLCILNIAIRRLSMNDTDMLKGLPALATLTLYIQTAPSERIFIDKGGFQVLTNFKFVCAVPCLSFLPGAMTEVQKLKLGFNSNQWRPYTFDIVGFNDLTGLIEVSVKFGIGDDEEFDIKAAESALEAAIMYHPNTPIVVDVISYVEENKSTQTQGKNKIMGRSEEIRQAINRDEKKIHHHHLHSTRPTPGNHDSSPTGNGEVGAFQRLAAALLIDLLPSSEATTAPPEILSIAWTGQLINSFLICLEEFRAMLLGFPFTRPPHSNLVNDFSERTVIALDLCNALRGGVDLLSQCRKHLAITAAALASTPGAPLGEGQIRRARKALTELTILMLEDNEANGGQRNRSFGRACNSMDDGGQQKDRGHHRSSSGSHFRSLSSSVSRSCSASRQLRAIVGHLPMHRANDATRQFAAAVYTMGIMLFITTWVLAAAIPCQDRILQVPFDVPNNFPWSGPVKTLYGRIIEESKKKERTHSCGLLKEIHQMERLSRQLMETTDVAQFPLGEKKEAEMREAAKELVEMCQTLKDGLDPLERQVREMFHRIAHTRTEIMDADL